MSGRSTKRIRRQAQHDLLVAANEVMDLPDRHCLLVMDASGQHGVAVTRDFMAICERFGELAKVANPRDPMAAIKKALMSLHPPTGGVH